MKTDEIMQKLAAPFPSSDVEWRIQNTNKDKTRGLAVPYIDSRAIQDRLDSVLGSFCWKPEYRQWHQVKRDSKPSSGQKSDGRDYSCHRDGTPDEDVNSSQLCGLAIYYEERGDWVQKWDGAENSDIEPVKGGISDSFKRAAVLWGIGRYLYKIDPVWVEIVQRGRSFAIPDNQRPTLDKAHEDAVARIFGKTAPADGNHNGDKAAAAAGQGSNTKTGVTGKRTTAARLSAKEPAVIDFDYTVKNVSLKKFASGKSMVLTLHDPKRNGNVTAYLQGEHPDIAEGVCLKNVQLSCHGSGTPSAYNTIDRYEVAA